MPTRRAPRGHEPAPLPPSFSGEGEPVRYVRTTFLPDDETCFHVFVADSAETVDKVCRRAGLGRVRIALAVETATQKASSRRAASTTRAGEGM